MRNRVYGFQFWWLSFSSDCSMTYLSSDIKTAHGNFTKNVLLGKYVCLLLEIKDFWGKTERCDGTSDLEIVKTRDLVRFKPIRKTFAKLIFPQNIGFMFVYNLLRKTFGWITRRDVTAQIIWQRQRPDDWGRGCSPPHDAGGCGCFGAWEGHNPPDNSQPSPPTCWRPNAMSRTWLGKVFL